MSRFHEERGNVTRLHIKEEVIQESLEKHQNILPEGKPKCFPVVRFKKQSAFFFFFFTISLDSLSLTPLLLWFLSLSLFFSNPLCFGQKTESVNTFVLTLDMLSQILLQLSLSFSLFIFLLTPCFCWKDESGARFSRRAEYFSMKGHCHALLTAAPPTLTSFPASHFAFSCLYSPPPPLPPSQHSVSAVCHQVKKVNYFSLGCYLHSQPCSDCC